METSPTAVTAVTAGAGHGEPGCLHRSAHAAADKGRARVRRRRGDGRCCCLCRRRCPALSHHHHHQADTDITISTISTEICCVPTFTTRQADTDITIYWSLLSVPSITEYKALQIHSMAAAYLRSPSPRHGYPDLHLSISRPSLAQCPPCPATGQN